jgi:hypothetical protein
MKRPTFQFMLLGIFWLRPFSWRPAVAEAAEAAGQWLPATDFRDGGWSE